MKKVLITGASGYIGSVLYEMMKELNWDIWTVDREYNTRLDLSKFIDHDLVTFPSWDTNQLEYQFDSVVHLAALVRVGESMEFPHWYYYNNIQSTMRTLKDFKYKNFVFASTGAAANNLTSPYAISKRACEDIVREYAKDDYTILRFYNVCGTAYDVMPTNPDGLLSAMIRAKNGETFKLYGNDYDTKDGSAVRDYIHVKDICRTIIAAVETPTNSVEHIGTGTGYTVLEMVEAFKKYNDCDFEMDLLPRRQGDLEKSVLDNPSKITYTIDSNLKSMLTI